MGNKASSRQGSTYGFTTPQDPLDHLRRHFRSLIEEAGRSPNSYTYDPSPDRGGHIVSEAFTYVKRTSEEQAVCHYMSYRQQKRNTQVPETDKKNNPLIAIPGSPGSGKSTFQAHFPCSDEFRAYVEQHSGGDGKQAIVSTLTFNSGMESDLTAFGLRILYGAAKGMGLDLKGKDKWPDFEKAYTQRYGSLTAVQAVEVLRYTFGENRRILILVDEINKSRRGKKDEDTERAVLEQLCRVLTFCGDVDVLVSSLSPYYIRDLMTGSNRDVIYVFPAPLLELALGQDASFKWASDVLAATNITVPPHIQALLRNVYLLFSGHPRSLEKLKAGFEIHEIDNEVVSKLQSTRKLTKLLLETLVPKMENYYHRFDLLDSMTPEQLERFMFSTPNSFGDDDEEFQDLLENGCVFIQGIKGADKENPRFSVAMPVLKLLQWIHSDTGPASSRFPRTRAAEQLLKDLVHNDNMADWWVRVVALTVVCRSFERRSLSDVLGVRLSPPNFQLDAHGWNWFKFSPRVISAANGSYPSYPTIQDEGNVNSDSTANAKTKTNTLDVYSGGQRSGFDAHAVVGGESDLSGLYLEQHVYMQMNLGFPKAEGTGEGIDASMREKTSDEMIAHAVPLTLLHHLWRYHPNISEEEAGELDLTNVHFVLYNWVDLGNSTAATKEGVLKACCGCSSGDLDSIVADELEKSKSQGKGQGKTLPAGFNELVNRFLEDHLMNIHFVNQPKLKELLLPTLVPLPPLLAAIDSSVDAVE